MKQQGSWTRWEGFRRRSLSWKDIWNMEGHRIKFLLSSVYDVLPTPTNLQRWRLTEDPSCALCKRPDIVLWSQATRQVALIELTVPWEERIEEAHERKLGKYQSLISESQQAGWRAWNLPVEVGCRGFLGQSLWRALGMLGVRGATRKNLVNNIAKQAETASRWLWLKRSERWLNQAGREGGGQS
ncbi:hypothetical protein DPEC_G00258670 [Dallia pectoralis]|uniref:Uncharacterized protein n=1 Tax=Dallia pectoralis TaxID=75939 RepID=A0ACC2FQV9_DALPE|nr:hypothetical protein DPEC_G00258670 [Dallia pectoralis]